MPDKKPVWQEHVDRGIELLQLCSDLQSEKDGVNRPKMFSIDKSKIHDEFSRDIEMAATYLSSLYKFMPMMEELSSLGRKLEAQSVVHVCGGDDYARAALNHFLQQNGIEPSAEPGKKS